jgi:hypothetical protein
MLRENHDLEDGMILTSWIVVYEVDSMSVDHDPIVGHFYGPEGMKTWRALGLIEWVRRFCLRPHEDDDDEDDAES